MRSSTFLTKTDYKLARQCPTKLFYFRRGYPSSSQLSEYLELLKDGGHMIGEMARVVHREGIYVGLGEGLEAALARTAAELEKPKVTLFEAAFAVNGMLAVVDILEKNGEDLNIIEVKSKSFDSSKEYVITGKKGEIKAEWQEYIEDVAFQLMVVGECRPELRITPYLLLPDKSKKTEIDCLASYFSMEKRDTPDGTVYPVKFTGDKEALARSNFLTRINVREPCAFIMPLVQQEAHKFVVMINPELRKVQYHLGKHCGSCEYYHDEPQLSGFHECWGEMAAVTPSIFDLYFGGALKKDGKYLFDELIAERKVSLYDIPESAIKGKRGERQRIQIDYSRSGREWVSAGFESVMQSFEYPLHFIDFETATSAIPYHKEMRPYEQIAFQWSCHVIESPGSEPTHKEWINLADSFPSFKFAESLMSAIAPQGTVFMWAQHESLVLKDIKRQMAEYGHDNDGLITWIDAMVGSSDLPGRLVDMNELCLEHYFHPEMRGKTSIKYTLPAIWNNNPYLWEIPHFRHLLKRDEHGRLLAPYAALEEIEIEGVKQVVKEGTNAMIAYQEMMFGLSREKPDIKAKWSQLLLQYCKLDTLAMVIIFTHWNKLASSGAASRVA
ncbi:MAG: DUF2779 domain-containing protein [Deltaproteobacteria bacterium]|nr:DUF2779 domain-containing protein [Deltaproteobacteria bacterium]